MMLCGVCASPTLTQVPAPFNLEAVMKAKQDDPSALHVVLFQEVGLVSTYKAPVAPSQSKSKHKHCPHAQHAVYSSCVCFSRLGVLLCVLPPSVVVLLCTD